MGAQDEEDIEELETEGGIEVQPDGDDDADACDPTVNWADLLGPDCVIKRVDKDKNVVGGANPQEMQQELMTRAGAQKRLGACAEHVKDMGRQEKLNWALGLKDKGNEFFYNSSFEEAAKLYNDCLVALDLEGSEEQTYEVQQKLQLPVCTNLAACMIEMGQYPRCIEICEVALAVDSRCCKALYRRGLARYRLGNHVAARPDFEGSLQTIAQRREELASGGGKADFAGKDGLDDIERRAKVYLGHIRRFSIAERNSCKRMFENRETSLYEDRPGAKEGEEEEEDDVPLDDSDEALDAAMARIRGDWTCCCPCRRRAQKKTQ